MGETCRGEGWGKGFFFSVCIKTLSRGEQDLRLNLPDPGECQGKGGQQPPCSERDSRESATLPEPL